MPYGNAMNKRSGDCYHRAAAEGRKTKGRSGVRLVVRTKGVLFTPHMGEDTKITCKYIRDTRVRFIITKKVQRCSGWVVVVNVPIFMMGVCCGYFYTYILYK